MKLTKLLLFAVLALCFASCGSDDDGHENGKLFKIANSGRQAMIDGVVESIKIEGGSWQYTVKSDNESVATATIEISVQANVVSYYARIKAIKKGKATFTITDGNDERSVVIEVVDPYKAYIVVGIEIISEATDKAKEQLIESELKDRAYPKEGAVMMLVKDKDRTMYVTKTEISNQIVGQGVYEFIKVAGQDLPSIKYKINDKSDTYQTGGEGQLLNSMLSFYVPNWVRNSTRDTQIPTLLLSNNLTAEYVAQYPEAGVSSAQIVVTVAELDPGLNPLPSK